MTWSEELFGSEKQGLMVQMKDQRDKKYTFVSGSNDRYRVGERVKEEIRIACRKVCKSYDYMRDFNFKTTRQIKLANIIQAFEHTWNSYLEQCIVEWHDRFYLMKQLIDNGSSWEMVPQHDRIMYAIIKKDHFESRFMNIGKHLKK